MSSNVMAKKKSSPQTDVGRERMTRRRIPGRKATKAKWIYVSPHEDELFDWCAALDGRSFSSWAIDVLLANAIEQARIYNRASETGIPGATELLASVQRFNKK